MVFFKSVSTQKNLPMGNKTGLTKYSYLKKCVVTKALVTTAITDACGAVCGLKMGQSAMGTQVVHTKYQEHVPLARH